jgi:hypothetical protein
MFRTELVEFHFATWLLQQIAASVLPLTWVFLTAPFRELLAKSLGYPIGRIADVIWTVVFIWGIGLVFGFSMGVLFAGVRKTGRLVWIAPCALYACLLVWELVNYPLQIVLLDMFAGTGENSWAVWLFTFPTVSSVLYAIGIVVAERTSVRGFR